MLFYLLGETQHADLQLQSNLVNRHFINWDSATKGTKYGLQSWPLANFNKNWFVPIYVNWNKKNQSPEVLSHMCALETGPEIIQTLTVFFASNLVCAPGYRSLFS